MNIINTLKDINNQLAELIENDEYTSIGYIPIINTITASDIVTIKKAQKLLDVIIVQNVANQELDDFTKQALKQINPNLVIEKLIDEVSNEISINMNIENINTINLTRGILAVLPSSVFINQESFETFKAINILESTFNELFSLHNISTPESLHSFNQLEVIKTLQSLEKSGNVSKEIIISQLNSFDILQYQEFNINDDLYINLKLDVPTSKQLINVSYCFKGLTNKA